MPIERAVKKHELICVTTNSMWDDIVLWELQEQKCQQILCHHTDVAQYTPVGWMVLILQWKMVKLTGGYALVIIRTIAGAQQ